MAISVVTDLSNTQDSRVLTWNCGTLAVGDIIVVTIVTEDSTLAMQAPVATTVTFTQRVLDATTSHTWQAIYTGVVTGAGAKSVTSTKSGAWTLKLHSGVCTVFPTADGYSLGGTPNTADTAGTGAPSANITATSGSIICALNGDWAAIDGASRAYTGSVTEDGYMFSTGVATGYFWHQIATTGTNTIGLSAPIGETFITAAVEVLGSAVATQVSNLAMAPMTGA